MPRRNHLGGNVVWLRTEGRSYYYAHLERAAVDAPHRVEAGDVVGYVGNSGNARTTPTHLHFGLYRCGTGPIDPLPYLRASQFEGPPTHAPLSPRFVLTTASKLNLRAGPSRRAPVLDLLAKGTVAWVDGASGEWTRVQIAGRPRGWIHTAYQTPLDAPLRERRAARPALLMRPVGGRPTPVGVIPAGAVIETLADVSGSELVRLQNGGLDSGSGWYQPLRVTDSRSASAHASY